ALEALQRVLAAEGGGARAHLLAMHHVERPAASRITRAPPFTVRVEARSDVVGDSRIERAIAAAEQVDVPGHEFVSHDLELQLHQRSREDAFGRRDVRKAAQGPAPASSRREAAN